MSSAFAIAAVSAVLRQLLDDGLHKHDLSFLGSMLDTTVRPLDSLSIGQADERPHLNLFLYQVTPNSGWRNVNLPSRGESGERISNPPLALDLHYLLTASGNQRLQADTLLGFGMQILHECPFLSREYITRILSFESDEPDIKAVAVAKLADQVEQIRICPQAMSIEEMSKLWSIIGVKYRPSVAYLASVVLIQSEKETRSQLPVLRIGQDNRGVKVQPDLIPPYPAIEKIDLPRRQTSALPGDTLTIVGYHFTEDIDGPLTVDKMTVRLVHPRLSESIDIDVSSDHYTNTRLTVSLPAQCPAGVCTLSILITPQDSRRNSRATHEFPLSVAPRLKTINGQELKPAPDLPIVPRSNIDDNGLGDLILSLTCEPQVLPEQRVELLLGNYSLPANPRAEASESLTFTAKKIRADAFRLRLRVDGVDSLLIDRSDERQPKFDETQQVILR